MFRRAIRKLKRYWPLPVVCFMVFYFVIWNQITSTKKYQDPNWVNVRLSKGQTEYVDRRGVHVVVGRYVPNNEPKINLTWTMLNANNYNPEPAAGANGRPVLIPPRDLLEMQQQYQIHRYNLMASNRIPVNRTLPDVRRKRCQKEEMDINKLPKTSVIIVFHNEAWSALVRTVWSVINRSPHQLVKEILLIDDASDRVYLGASLEKYISELPVKTKILRSKKRIGLINARLMGANAATAEVLTFLDAHCECTTGWLEPLLHRISQDKKTVVCPIIDIISDETFAYTKSFNLYYGAMNWQLTFRWYTALGERLEFRKKDIIRPFTTPVMAGGLFSIDKNYFFEMGAYDPEMKIWGGENFELSFRLWQCGGRIEIVPCSHVGHLFRKSSPYSYPDGIDRTLFSNLARVALVWMDQWGDFFFKFNQEASKFKQQNITERLELRKRLKCKSFEWYLNNVWPEHFFPKDGQFFGRIKHIDSNTCILRPFGLNILNKVAGTPNLISCLEHYVIYDMYVYNSKGEIITDENVCFDASEGNKTALNGDKLRINPFCGGNRQKWKYDNKTKEIIQVSTNRCLQPEDERVVEGAIIVTRCTGKSNQKWMMDNQPWR